MKTRDDDPGWIGIIARAIILFGFYGGALFLFGCIMVNLYRHRNDPPPPPSVRQLTEFELSVRRGQDSVIATNEEERALAESRGYVAVSISSSVWGTRTLYRKKGSP